MVVLFSHARGSPFFGIGIYVDCFHCLGHVAVSHIVLQVFVIIAIASFPPTLSSSIGILSIPGAFPLAASFNAQITSPSDIDGSLVKSLT